eukprot:symbB.v1.2.038718.t1/scaffold6139.1/size20637/2
MVPDEVLPEAYKGRECYLASLVLPMGYLNSVSLAQHVHRNLALASGKHFFPEVNAPEGELRKDLPFPDCDPRWRIYLDNYDLLERVEATKVLALEGSEAPGVTALKEEYDRWQVPRNVKKSTSRSTLAELQGAQVDGQLGVAYPKEAKLLKYVVAALQLCEQGKASQRQLQVVCGGLVYVSMFRRPLLGCLNTVWQLIGSFEGTGQRVKVIPTQCKLEILRFLCLVPLARMDFRLELDPKVSCSDASEKGGGLCSSVGLSSLGHMVAAGALRGQVQRPGEDLSVLCVGLFDGIGALRVALDLLGCQVMGHISVESNAAASRVVESHFPGVEVVTDVKLVDDAMVHRFAGQFSQVSLVLVGAGPPCQRVSGLNADRRGALRDERSSLFSHVRRIRSLFELHFPWCQVHSLMESVASMDDLDRDIMSADFGSTPWSHGVAGRGYTRSDAIWEPFDNLQFNLRRDYSYNKAVDLFMVFLRNNSITLPSKRDLLDPLVCDYLEHLWYEGSGRGLANDTLAGLQDVDPKIKGCLPGAWRLLKTWGMNEVPSRAPPLPESVLQAMAGWAFFHNHASFGISLLIGFYGMLRTGEILSLKRRNLSSHESQEKILISLGLTKSGKRAGAAESTVLGYDKAVRPAPTTVPAWVSAPSPDDACNLGTHLQDGPPLNVSTSPPDALQGKQPFLAPHTGLWGTRKCTFIHGCSSGTLSVVIPCETAPMVGAGAAVHPALPWILRVMLGFSNLKLACLEDLHGNIASSTTKPSDKSLVAEYVHSGSVMILTSSKYAMGVEVAANTTLSNLTLIHIDDLSSTWAQEYRRWRFVFRTFWTDDSSGSYNQLMLKGRLAYFPLGPEPQLLWHGQKHMRNASERPCGGVAVLCFLVYSNFQLMVTCWRLKIFFAGAKQRRVGRLQQAQNVLGKDLVIETTGDEAFRSSYDHHYVEQLFNSALCLQIPGPSIESYRLFESLEADGGFTTTSWCDVLGVAR